MAVDPVNAVGSLWHGVLLLTAFWSAIHPADALTWCLDMAPAVVIYLSLLAARRSFPLTPLSCWLTGVLLTIIVIGAHYGFGAVPWFDWLRMATGGTRNHFDKLAHFFQGAAPAAVFREILLRCQVAPGPVWLAALTSALTLALSAAYELVEWVAALLLQERAERFIASQGDPWDAQSDMALALSGAVLILALCSRVQDRQIAALLGRQAGQADAGTAKARRRRTAAAKALKSVGAKNSIDTRRIPG